jgi:TatD DNase family protein
MKPTYIDIHAHVQFSVFDADREEVLKRAHDAGVAVINVGTHFGTSEQAIKIAESHPWVYATIGLHPIHANPYPHGEPEKEDCEVIRNGEVFDAEKYRALAKSKKVVAIGECGLDFFRTENPEYKRKQEVAFRQQIELALELDLPLMLHVRNAYDETLSILREYKERAGDKLRGDAHFFAGSKEQAQHFLDLGFNLSFTGVVTFAKQYKELVEMTPHDRIMSETDSPYVAPVPNRGKRNEPLFVRDVAIKIADIKSESTSVDFYKQLVSNAEKLFKLDF